MSGRPTPSPRTRPPRRRKLSAHNQLQGRVTAVKSGAVMAEIEVQIEPGQVVAAITDTSRQNLDLKEGDQVTVVIKSTAVLIAK